MSRFFAFDVMGEIGFSKSYGMLERFTTHEAIQALIDCVSYFGTLGELPWAAYILKEKIPTFGLSAFVTFGNWCVSEMDRKMKVSYGKSAYNYGS